MTQEFYKEEAGKLGSVGVDARLNILEKLKENPIFNGKEVDGLRIFYADSPLDLSRLPKDALKNNICVIVPTEFAIANKALKAIARGLSYSQDTLKDTYIVFNKEQLDLVLSKPPSSRGGSLGESPVVSHNRSSSIASSDSVGSQYKITVVSKGPALKQQPVAAPRPAAAASASEQKNYQTIGEMKNLNADKLKEQLLLLPRRLKSEFDKLDKDCTVAQIQKAYDDFITETADQASVLYLEKIASITGTADERKENIAKAFANWGLVQIEMFNELAEKKIPDSRSHWVEVPSAINSDEKLKLPAGAKDLYETLKIKGQKSTGCLEQASAKIDENATKEASGFLGRCFKNRAEETSALYKKMQSKIRDNAEKTSENVQGKQQSSPHASTTSRIPDRTTTGGYVLGMLGHVKDYEGKKERSQSVAASSPSLSPSASAALSPPPPSPPAAVRAESPASPPPIAQLAEQKDKALLVAPPSPHASRAAAPDLEEEKLPLHSSSAAVPSQYSAIDKIILDGKEVTDPCITVNDSKGFSYLISRGICDEGNMRGHGFGYILDQINKLAQAIRVQEKSKGYFKIKVGGTDTGIVFVDENYNLTLFGVCKNTSLELLCKKIVLHCDPQKSSVVKDGDLDLYGDINDKYIAYIKNILKPKQQNVLHS